MNITCGGISFLCFGNLISRGCWCDLSKGHGLAWSKPGTVRWHLPAEPWSMRPLDEKGSKNERLIRNRKDLESVWVWITLKQKHPAGLISAKLYFLDFCLRFLHVSMLLVFQDSQQTKQAIKEGSNQSRKEGRKQGCKRACNQGNRQGRKEGSNWKSKQANREGSKA